MRTPGALPLREMAEFDPQHGGLNFVEAAVPARLAAPILGGLPVIAQRTKVRGEFSRIRNDHSGISIRTKVLCRVEAEARRVPEGAGTATFIECANGLRTILDERQLAGLCECQDGIHVCREAVEMYRDDGARARGNAALQFGGIEIVSLRTNVDKDRLRSQGAYRAARSDEGIRRQEHFIACLHAARAQSQNQRVRAGRDSYAVSHAT